MTRPVDERQLRVGFVVLLVAATAYVLWFDWAALAAILHPTTDRAGRVEFAVPGYSNTVYPFTYVAAAASLLGVAYYVVRREVRALRPIYALFLGLLVGNLAAVGMIDAYEQPYVVLSGQSYWVQQYWGSPGGIAYTLGGILIVFVVLPWVRRANLPGVVLMAGIFAVSMGVWVAVGIPATGTDTSLGYAMNALSRVASQLALVAAVAAEDWVLMLRRGVRRVLQLLRDRGAAGRGATSP